MLQIVTSILIKNNWNISCISKVIKKNPFCEYSDKLFLKDVKMDGFWVGHSVMKPVGVESFKRKKYIKEGCKEKNDNFDMDILEKGAL